jgi:phosphoribosyl-ATP pyrophosphohydrolase
MAKFTLEDLAKIVASRAESGDPDSYTAKLTRQGISQCAKKLGEEAVETAISAVKGDREGLKGEAADLLYHLLVLLNAVGVPLEAVMAELQRRTAQTGLQEKAGRTGT